MQGRKAQMEEIREILKCYRLLRNVKSTARTLNYARNTVRDCVRWAQVKGYLEEGTELPSKAELAAEFYFSVVFDDWWHGMIFHFVMQGATRGIRINLDNVGWSAGEAHHFAVAYDRQASFAGAKTISIFLDGVEIASSSEDWGSYDKGTGPFVVCNAISGVGIWKLSGTYIDNLKIWNYPKTDFSDRFVE